MRIHNVFHVSLLKPYEVIDKVKPLPSPIIENEDIFYYVERVLQHEVRGSCSNPLKFYLIEWLSYELEHNSWEPKANLNPELCKEYWGYVAHSGEHLSCHDVGHESLHDILPKLKRYRRS